MIALNSLLLRIPFPWKQPFPQIVATFDGMLAFMYLFARRISLLLILGGMIFPLQAQVLTGRDGDQVNFPDDPGFQGINLSLDSTRRDSSLKKKDIKPDVKSYDRQAFFEHLPFQFPVQRRLDNQHLYDELHVVEGFVQSLGQTGKPYQIWRDGIKEQYLLLDVYRDPILNKYQHYMIDAEHKAKFYDTKTPYVNVQYMQGPDRLQVTDVTVSRNITPNWNGTFFIQRMLSESAYREMLTDHVNLYLSSNYHGFNDRYHAYGVVTYNQFSDGINGGVPRDTNNANYVFREGDLIKDSSVLFSIYTGRTDNVEYNSLFFKGTQAPLLASALRQNRFIQGYLDHFYDLIPESDSAKIKNRLTLRNKILWETSRMTFADESIGVSALSSNLIPVYPTLATDSTDIYENWLSRRFNIAGLLSYSLQTRGGFQVNLNGGINYQVLQFVKDTTLATQNSTDQIVNGSIVFPIGIVKGHIRQRISDRFSAERDINITADLQPWAQVPLYKIHPRFARKDTANEIPKPDSLALYRPVSLQGSFMLRDMNPSMFQAFFVGDSGNAYIPNPSLGNQLLTHADVSLRYDFPVKLGLQDTLVPMYLKVRGFLSRVDNPIYYDQAFQVVQDNENSFNWLGIETAFRLRFWRKFYFETNFTYQFETAAADNLQTRLQEQSAPNWYGKSFLYYENKNISFGEQFRIGLDAHYFGPFAGQTLDPISSEYFATNYEMSPFVNIGAYAAIKLRGVYLWGRVQQATEGVFTNGYFTTPFYPMLERAITFGVNWSFYN